MKILVATGIYPPEIGGPATYTVLLEAELPQYGHQVTALPFSVSRHLPKVVRHINYSWKLWKKAAAADIIFAQDVASVGLPALLVAKMRRKTFFVRVPGDYAWEQSAQRYGVSENIDEFQKKSYGLKIETLRLIQKCVTRFSDQVITPSNYFKELVTDWGVAKEKVTTIYNGVSLDVTPAEIHKPSDFTIVSAGRLVPWKGFVALIEIVKSNPAWHLVILGDGPERERLEALVSEYGLEDRVSLKGAVTRPEIFGWCKAADAFVLNTEFESFSYQIVEAMSVGSAIITTKVGSIPELITNGIEGVLVQPNDSEAITLAIQTVVKEPEVWASRKLAAHKKAQTFSIAQTVGALISVVKKYE